MGGLGNYLFQVAAGYSKSIDLNVNYVVNPNHVQVVHKPLETYLDNIFRHIKLDGYSSFGESYYETHFHYSPIPDFKSPTIINGYFQSEKYFKHHENEIKSLFECPELLKNKLINKYEVLKNSETCSIHVRRGDYLALIDHHPVQDMDYYNQSISIIGEDKTFLIFSDDIEWCKNNFSFLKNKIICEGNKDYEDLYLMSLCNHNIIANSSFSWWGSWLNTNNSKKIIAPKNWFGSSKSDFITKDIYCNDWVLM